MILRKLEAENFRLLEAFSLAFEHDVTVLVGPNNAGKSNILDALLIVKRALEAGSYEAALGERNGYERVVSQHDPARKLRLGFWLADDNEYHLTIDPPAGVTENAVILGTPQETQQRTIAHGPGAQNWEPVVRFFGGAVHVDPFRQVSFQYQVGAVSMAQATGTDLAQVLHYHYNDDPDRFGAFEDVVRRVLPEVDRIVTPITAGTSTTVAIRFRDGREKFDLWQLSSGVKDILVLLAAIHFSGSGCLLLLEEPENHLHPAAQKALAAVIRDAAANDQKQAIVTTHSELVMEQFEPPQVFFVDRRNGRAAATQLDQAEVFEVWERLGVERTRLLEALSRARQVILVMEGRDDLKALEPIWEHYELAETVLPVRTGGGGYRSIVDNAQALQTALANVHLSSSVFVLLDNDNEYEAKVSYLSERGFDATTGHVWSEKELESYLLIPRALATISGTTAENVQAAIAGASGRGKEKLDRVLAELGIPDVGKSTLVKNAIRAGEEHVPEEFKQLVAKLRALLGTARSGAV
jgi:predicted ATPase